MKNNIGLAVGVLALSTGLAVGQPNLQLISPTATEEGYMRLAWTSQPGGIYRIDEADALVDPDTGVTAWHTLYEDYPSQGTNTFWLDTGNDLADPAIPNPNHAPVRFYRVALTGVNTTPTTPTVAILSPAAAASINGSFTITVRACSDQFFLATKLYVDGQEMNNADTSTNWTDASGLTNYIEDTYTLNSSEWPNGAHTLFATVSCQTGATGPRDAGDVGIGYGVSPFVPVQFNNLITRIAFSQPFFTPEDGQTQRVTARFTANCNWTLNIVDASSNVVRSASGSGADMAFDWDGKGNGGLDLPVGNYYYRFSAQTNGARSLLKQSASLAPSTLQLSDAPAAWWAAPADGTGAAVPLALFPPGADLNNSVIFQALPSEVSPARFPSAGSLSLALASPSGISLAGASPADAGANTPAAQTNTAPTRPPIEPVKGRAGVYGLAYDTYSANGAHYQLAPPLNGLLTQHVMLEGKTTVADSTFNYEPLKQYKKESSHFVEAMKKGNWSQGFAKVDDHWSINDLRGPGSMFNGVKLGLVLLHGTYGTSPDYTSGANGCQQMYFPITSGQSAQYLRMSEMNLGNSDPNGLKWMAIAACNSLQHTAWANMKNAGVRPYNGGLHLLLGTDSVVWTDDHIMEKWAQYMTKGKGTNGPMTIANAWINGAKDAYQATKFNYGNPMIFAVAGDNACMNDTLNTNSPPSGSWTYSNLKVWPLP